MTSSEEQQLLARISQLAGKINLHKAQQAGVQSIPSSQASYHRPVYDKTNEATAKAIEATRQKKLLQREAREKSQLANHFQRYGGHASAPTTPTNTTAVGNHEIEIQGLRYRVANNGSKLVKVSGDLHPVSATPKVTYVGGVKFHRSKRGNLYRAGVLRAHRHHGVKKVDVPCSMFSLTGSCAKGPACRYQHDASKVAVCRELLHKGTCAHEESCDLSHDLIPQRTPTCVHFIKGNCANPNCPYAHSSVSPGALVCRSFGMYGYCDKGEKCEERHVFECPDFSNTGKCKTKGCKLLHRERASVLRKRTDDNEMEDLSSDEESADSDDVDSDEVEEFINDPVGDDSDFRVQKDFIAF
ncbi:hypothetical protein KNSL1_006697 [Colletotrichum chrysophilum]|nr:hypothetical protein KNSL1_006697 [Colletotrichum chrysophilum]